MQVAWYLAAMVLSGPSGEIVGSSTVTPLAEKVAKNIDQSHLVSIEPTGSNKGFALLCSKTEGAPAVSMASRALSSSELGDCEAKTGENITAHELGASGVALAVYRSSDLKALELTRADIFMALAAKVPSGSECKMVENPHSHWSDIRDDLPNVVIRIIGPGKDSGTYSSFVDLAMVPGAREDTCMAALEAEKPGTLKSAAKALRTDIWTDAPEDDVALVKEIHDAVESVGILGFSSASRFKRHLEFVSIEGIAPSMPTIVDGSYPLRSKLYLYVSDARLEKDAASKAFVDEFLSNSASGADGYLTDHGLISLK